MGTRPGPQPWTAPVVAAGHELALGWSGHVSFVAGYARQPELSARMSEEEVEADSRAVQLARRFNASSEGVCGGAV